MSDLTNRMRTAAELLIEAANALETRDPLSEPVEGELWRKRTYDFDAPFPHTDAMAQAASEHSGIPPETRSLQACPKCDSRFAKRVARGGDRLFLFCPACSYQWPFP